jgi:hypothetical protein
MAENQEKPKIILDDDWKAQAQAEKEKLSEQVEEEAGHEGPGGELPPANFAGLVNALVSNIVFALGGYDDPRTGRRFIDLNLAKHYVDLLAVLEEKTRNNLSEDEKKLMDAALYETRMQYVQIAQRASSI